MQSFFLQKFCSSSPASLLLSRSLVSALGDQSGQVSLICACAGYTAKCSLLTFEQNSKPISNNFENSEKNLNNFKFFQNSEQFPKQLGLFSRIWKIFKQLRIFFLIRLISCPYTALKRYVIIKKKKKCLEKLPSKFD